MARPRSLALAIVGAALATIGSAKADDPVCDYDVTILDATARKVEIAATCDPALGVEKFSSLSDRALWSIAPDSYGGGKGRFTFELAQFADRENDMGSAMTMADAVMVTPGYLLPLPDTDRAAMLRFRFTFPSGGRVLTALRADAEGRYSVPLLRLDEVGPLVLGSAHGTPIAGDPELTLVLPAGDMAIPQEQLSAWVSAVAEGNRRFWGGSPAKGGLVVLVPSSRGGIPFGRVLSLGGAVVTVLVGRDATTQDLYDDWVLVHEFLHLGTPLMRDTGAWLNEGIATFYEPTLRTRAGWKSEDEVWREWISMMPRGLNAMAESGLQNGGRGGTYWGGALFVLMAEIESLQASGGKIGFSDCLRKVLADGGDVTVKWQTRRLLGACDALLGKPAILPLADQHIPKGTAMTLENLWRRLGVSMAADGAIHCE